MKPLMAGELGRMKREELVADLSQYPGICLERVRETTKDPFQHFPSSVRNLNPEATEEGPEYSVTGINSMK
jgi:hypothetical protein